MSSPSDGNFPASFEARSASLRRLARSLLNDASAADDVVQETWAAYLDRPPVDSASTDGFLATLARRLAWKSRRSEVRRREREIHSARSERTPGPDEIAERANALHEVLELVSSLREPYRRAIWQRYFDDLPPREIARASGESLATVKSRLQRGLEMLREELDRRHGGRRKDWALALMPLVSRSVGTIGLGISGGLLMGTTLKLGAATALIACAVGLFIWTTHGTAPEPGELLVADTSGATAASDGTAAPTLTPSAPTRSAVDDPVEAQEAPLVVESELTHPYLYLLAVRCVDENGLPVLRAPLKLAPVRSSLNVVSSLTESEGWTTIAWRGKQAEMDVDLQQGGSDRVAGSRRLHLRAGIPTEVAVLGQGSRPQVFRLRLSDAVVNVEGQAVSGVFEERLSRLGSAQFDGALRMERFPHPHARFGDRFVYQGEPAPPQELDMGRLESDSVRGQLKGARFARSISLSGTMLAADELSAAPDASIVTLHVQDERGEAVPNCLVALGHQLDGTDQMTFTDEKGDARFEAVGSGWWEARAGGGARGLARERLFVTAPNPLHWDAHLDRAAHLIGHAFDVEGKPLKDYIVRFESTPSEVPRGSFVLMATESASSESISEGTSKPLPSRSEWRAPWVDSTTVQEDGSFELANLPPGPGRLLLLAAENPDGAALVVEEGVLPGERDYVLKTGVLGGTLAVEIRLPEPWQSESVEVRAISETTGRGVSFALDGDVYRRSNLAAGWYRVELGAGALGWHDLGRHYIDGEGTLELGKFSPPLPAAVRVFFEEAKEGKPELGLTFYLRRPDLDLRGEPKSLLGSEVLHMPPGEYWVFWTAFDGTVRHRALSLEAGATVELDLRDAR